MTDIKMGFKHTLLQRMQNKLEMFGDTKELNQNMPSVPEIPSVSVTDFSINRILSENNNINKKSTQLETSEVHEVNEKKYAADILDLSKSALPKSASPTNLSSNTTLPFAGSSFNSYHQLAAGYGAFYPEFLAATKFYAQFLPHLFPNYALPTATISNSAAAATHATAYHKRFAPYVINNRPSCSPNNISSSNNSAYSPKLLPTSPLSSCPRADCMDCLSYYKPQYASPTPSVASSVRSSASLSNIGSYLKSKASNETMQHMNNAPAASSGTTSISLTTVTQLNLSNSSNITATANLAAATAEEISYKCRICDKVFGCAETLQVCKKINSSNSSFKIAI